MKGKVPMDGAMVPRKGFTNGCEKRAMEKERRGVRRAPALIIVSLLLIGMMGAAMIGVRDDAKAVDWHKEYWDRVFFHLNNTTENQNFVDDFLTVYNASDWQHFNATRDLVLKGGINPMWLARYIAGNMWSREEFNILPELYNTNSSLKNYGNMSLIFTEVNPLQNGINESEAQMINLIFSSYLNLSPLEQKSLFLTPMNKTLEPPITTASKDNNNLKITSQDLKALEDAKAKAPMDSGDLMWWLWNNFSAQKGIDIHDLNMTKILWAYMSVFDGFLNHGHSWSDETVLNYISQQFDEFGLANLSAIANFPNSLIWLQQKIWPQTLYTKYTTGYGTNEFDSGVFWINHSWNNTIVDAYKQARQFWKDHNLDSQVVGKSGHKALNDLESWISGNLSKDGTPPDLGNFTLYYNNYFSKFLQGYKVPLDCEGGSTTAVFLIRAQNHLYLDNDTVTNDTKNLNIKIPLTAVQIGMYSGDPGIRHVDSGYINYNSTLNNIRLTLSDFGWQQFSSNKTKMQVQVPAAFWYEIESKNGINVHTYYGQVDVNIRGDDIAPPYYNVTAVPANETNQETNYSMVIEYVYSAREGAIKVAHGYNNAPYSRNVYDLLNRDNVPVPEFGSVVVPIFGALVVWVAGFRRIERQG